MRRLHYALPLLMAVSSFFACSSTETVGPDAHANDASDATDATDATDANDASDAGAFTLTSTAFADGTPIAAKYTCDGANVSPPLAWTSAPAATKSFVLVVDDPDAPTTAPFVHWVLFDVPPTTTTLTEGATAGTAGKNGFGTTAWGGPCPPPGAVHHYRFQLRALDVASLGTAAGATRTAIDAAAASHVLASTTLVGTYVK